MQAHDCWNWNELIMVIWKIHIISYRPSTRNLTQEAKNGLPTHNGFGWMWATLFAPPLFQHSDTHTHSCYIRELITVTAPHRNAPSERGLRVAYSIILCAKQSAHHPRLPAPPCVQKPRRVCCVSGAARFDKLCVRKTCLIISSTRTHARIILHARHGTHTHMLL